MFKKKAKPILGLDISSTAVKLLELGGSPEDIRVENYAVVPLPADSVVDKQVVDPEAVGEAIRKAVRKAGTRTKRAAIAVGGASVITKTIQLPAGLSDDDMEEQVRLEADQYIPFPLEEVGMDFEVLGPTEGSEGSVDVLLAACRSDNIDSRVAAVEIAGLECKVVDIEAYALENASELMLGHMMEGDSEQAIALLDMGATTTTLNIIQNHKVVYTRDQAFGGRQLTDEIMRHYGLSYEEAGKAKRQGGLPENYSQTVLQPFIEDSIQQINRALQFFFSSNNDIDMVDQIILAGGSASIEGLDTAVQEQLDIPTRVANPFANMKIPKGPKFQAMLADAPALMTACGLAMRGFD